MTKKVFLFCIKTIVIFFFCFSFYGVFSNNPFLFFQRVIAETSTIQSSSASIAAFAENWWWSKQYYQDGRYGETKITFSGPLPATIATAKLTVAGSYSQQSGSAIADVYIKTSQQVTPKDANHDKGSRWYGDTASLGTKAGSFSMGYSGATTEFDVTSYVSSNQAETYYVAVRNLAAADIGISKIQLTVTAGETKKSDGSSCSSASECQGGYCLHYLCRSSSTVCGDDYCDSGESCSSCPDDCGICKKSDGSSCSSASECEGGYCVQGKCGSSPSFCGDGICDPRENCNSCLSDCKCGAKQCCSPQSKNANSKGCVVSNQITTPDRICCQGQEYQGECCQDADCFGNKTCSQYYCVAKAACDNGSCEYWQGENCNSCSQDCNCFHAEACMPDLASADLYGCIRANKLTDSEKLKCKYIWCNYVRYDGNCCQDSDCGGAGKECSNYVCKTAPSCGDGLCQKEEGENCSTCQTDCGCSSYSNCCYPTSILADAKGCVGQKEKMTKYLICCEGSSHFGNCCSAEQCKGDEECWEYWCRQKPKCGDGICHYERGENCQTCASDCRCYGNDCCSPGSENTDKAGCLASRGKAGDSVCCFGKIQTGDCCSTSDCSSGKECLSYVCSVPQAQCLNNICEYEKGENCTCGDCACSPEECCEPSSENKNSKGCVRSGRQTVPGKICCNGEIHYGNCCSNSDCRGGEKCVGYHCTKFLDLFYKHYYRNEVAYGGGFVKHSALYRGISDFYHGQATQINIPIMSLGKFVQALDAISDTARSVVSLDIIGLTTNLSRFFEETETWELSEPEKLQNNILYFYSAAGLAYEFADRYGNIQPAIQALSSKLPFNNVLDKISKQHSALQSKIASEADLNQLFYFEVADFILDTTLLEEVNDYLRYDVLDYQQKIQLSITARELATIYEKAESYNLSEEEAWILMALEKEFWIGVLAKSINSINFEEVRKEWWMTQIYNALGANSAASIQAESETKNSAQTWLIDLENRRKVLFSVYLGMAEKGGWTETISSSFGSIINALKLQEILK